MTSAVYPSMIVAVCCPNCGAQGRVKWKGSLKHNLTVLCWRCAQGFLIKVNRRSSYRKKASIPVGFSLLNIDRLDDANTLKGTIVDISRHGMAVKSHRNTPSLEQYQEGSVVTFLFSLPLIMDLKKVQGEIRRVIRDEKQDNCTIGVKFTELHQFTDNAIRFFLSL